MKIEKQHTFDIHAHDHDAWGGIDFPIRKLVVTLNRYGFHTTGSCGGHVDHQRSPAPWIKISNNRTQMISLIRKFYTTRSTQLHVRIKTLKAHHGYWLYAGGNVFLQWRKQVNSRVHRKTRPQKPITTRLRRQRKKRLRACQIEMDTFSDFLHNLENIESSKGEVYAF